MFTAATSTPLSETLAVRPSWHAEILHVALRTMTLRFHLPTQRVEPSCAERGDQTAGQDFDASHFSLREFQ
jgi:hypothetical protein